MFHVVFISRFVISVVNENGKLKHELAIPTCETITVANDAIETQALVADKTNKDLSK